MPCCCRLSSNFNHALPCVRLCITCMAWCTTPHLSTWHGAEYENNNLHPTLIPFNLSCLKNKQAVSRWINKGMQNGWCGAGDDIAEVHGDLWEHRPVEEASHPSTALAPGTAFIIVSDTERGPSIRLHASVIIDAERSHCRMGWVLVFWGTL